MLRVQGHGPCCMSRRVRQVCLNQGASSRASCIRGRQCHRTCTNNTTHIQTSMPPWHMQCQAHTGGADHSRWGRHTHVYQQRYEDAVEGGHNEERPLQHDAHVPVLSCAKGLRGGRAWACEGDLWQSHQGQ